MDFNAYLNQQYNAAQQQSALQALAQGSGAYGRSSTTTYTHLFGQMGTVNYTPELPPAPKMQKTGKLLVDLRREIDDWHGDILRSA